MEIEFRTKQLRKRCETVKDASRKWGRESALKLVQRLFEIDAAEHLLDLLKLPAAKCHPLSGDREGQFAVRLRHPYRLVFEPVCEPNEYMRGNTIEPEKVTRVKILEVVDYHGK